MVVLEMERVDVAAGQGWVAEGSARVVSRRMGPQSK